MSKYTVIVDETLRVRNCYTIEAESSGEAEKAFFENDEFLERTTLFEESEQRQLVDGPFLEKHE